MKRVRRGLSLALTLIMALSLSPVQAMGAEGLLIDSPSGVAYDARVSYEIMTAGRTGELETRAAMVRFTLENPGAEPVSFDYTAVSGSASTGQHLTGTLSGTVLFSVGETQKDVQIEVAPLADDPANFGTPNDPDALWTGERIFFLFCDNVRNALFAGDRESLTVPVPVESGFGYALAYDNAANATLIDLDGVSGGENGVYPVPEGRTLKLTAEIASDVRKMLDAGVFTHLQMPEGYFLNETGATGSVGYRVSRSRQMGGGTYSDTPLTYDALSVGSGEEASFFSETYPQTVEVGQILLGQLAEGNGICQGLDFVFDYSGLTGSVSTCFLNGDGQYLRNQVRFADGAAPVVESVRISATEARYGDEIPVIISFSEPVYVDGITFQVGGATLSPMERAGTISESVSFLYAVGDETLDSAEAAVCVNSITGAVDLSGKAQESVGAGSATVAMSALDPERALIYCAEPSVTLDQGTSRNAVATVSVPLKRDGYLSNWLLDPSRLGDGNVSTAVKARAITADGAMDIPFTVQTDALGVTGLRGSFVAPENTAGTDALYALEIHLDTGSGYAPVYGLTTVYAVPPLTFIDDESDLTLDYSHWPPGDSAFADAGSSLSLAYSLNVNATWPDADYFAWASSNAGVAGIDADGNITLTGTGEVHFTLTVTNPLSADSMTFVSRTLTVLEADGAYLYVPNGLENLEALKGNAAKVSFSSNLAYRNDLYGGTGTETPYTFTLYAAEYEGAMLQRGEKLTEETLSATQPAPLTSYTVRSELLQTATVKGMYGYILEISARDMQSGQIYAAEANIRVRELPARAALTRPETVFLTDSVESFAIGFDIENRTAETEYLLTATRNSETEPVLQTGSSGDIGSSLTAAIASVGAGRLLDVYTVSLKAKNASDQAWSCDSYCVYVYSANAMEILVNGLPGKQTLMLEADFADGDILYATDVLRYRSGLGLSSSVSINGSDYAWSAIADKVTWSVEGDSVSLWYNAGGVPRRIGGDDRPILLPGAVLSLRGDEAGNATVTASHTPTGMSSSLNVSVAPVDRLYLFQTYPQVACDLVYTTGDGRVKTVRTGDLGQLGVYEESGIASDVAFYPTGGAETLYGFAVLSRGELTAAQNAAANFDLHPLHTVILPELNYTVSLELVDEGMGAAYTGDTIIRGGVYYNGAYQPTTTINGHLGNADQTVRADGEGRYRLAFSPADFTTRLKASDTLRYVIEVGFADNSHLTEFIVVENEAIQAGKDSPLGVCLTEGIQELDASSIQGSTVVLSQILTVNGRESPMSELLYLEEAPTSAILEMTLMLPGDYDGHYQLYIQSSAGGPYGYFGTGEVAQSFAFSDTVTLRFSCDIRNALRYAMTYTVAPGEKVAFYPVIRSTDGSTEIRLSKPVQVLNLLGMPRMDELKHGDTDYNRIFWLLSDTSSDSADLSFTGDSAAVRDALDLLEDYAIYSVSMGLEVQSTDDPLVYKGIIRYAAGSYSGDNPSGVFVGSGEATDYNFLPGLSDVKAMAKGTFLKKAKEEMNRRGGKVYGGGAYLECEIFFSAEEQEWKIRLLKGDVYLGGGGVFFRNYNGWISFVPITATFETRLTAELGLTILFSRNGDKTAYIPRLRPVFSVYGFGGFGRDYEVVALKAGVYGFAQHEQLYLWYKDSEGKTADGQRLTIEGEVGVEYEIKLAFIELHGKYVLTDASESWYYNDFNDINGTILTGLSSASRFFADESKDALTLVPLEEGASFEGRSYLETFDRRWGSPSSGMRSLALPSGEGLTDVWTNAYPYAAPSTSDDGELMAYLSDLGSEDVMDTAALFAVRDATGSFSEEGVEIAESAYPDGSLSLSGTKAGGASAVWVRSFTSAGGEAGGKATAEDAVGALAAAEVMAGIYKDGAFTSTRLTDNANPDLSPVTAAAGGNAIAAWRSVTLGGLDNPLAFTSDYVMYSVHDGTSWSEAKCLYDGSVEAVRALNAAMLDGGTAAVVYQIAAADGDSEIVCAVLGADGAIIQTLRLTDNATADENPQITALEFPDGTQRFVIGWNAQTGSGESAVRLVAVNADGTICPEFALELSDSAGGNGYASFRFTKGAEKLEDLSVLWSEPEDADDDGVFADVIFGAKLVQASDGTGSLSGRQELLTLDEGRTVDSLDARAEPGTNRVHLALLLSEPSGAATLATAAAGYRNTLTLAEPDFAYEDVLPGLKMPVRFTVTNDGMDPITKVTIALGDQTCEYGDGTIAPCETREFVVLYTVPAAVVDAGYTVTAQFGSAGETGVESGSLKLALPDVGIARIDLIRETQRERGFRVLLQNRAYADLKEGTHSVRLEVSAAADLAGTPLYARTISAAADLATLNDSLLSLDVTLSEEDLQSLLDESGEVPEGGQWVFFRVVLTEGGADVEDADSANDMDYAKIYSLIKRNGAAVSLASSAQAADGTTTIRVEAANNSMNAIANGNLVVTLRDEDGNALGTRQTYDSADDGSLLAIAGEDRETATFLFDGAGYTADVIFARVSRESTRLSALNLTGVPLEFDPDVREYHVQTHGLTETLLTAVAENPASAVWLARNGVPVSASSPIRLPYGTSVLAITVTTGETSVSYTVDVQNSKIDDGTEPGGDDAGSDGTTGDYSAALTIDGARRSDLSIRVNGGRAVISLGSLAQEIFSGDTEAALTIPAVSGADGYTLEAPADALAGSSSTAALTVFTELGSIRIPSEMLTGMAGLSGRTAGITIARADRAKLPDDIRAAVGGRPLLSLTLTLDGEQRDWSNPDAPVTVRIPYTPTGEELVNPDSIIIWYIDGNGNAFCVPSGRYDASSGTVTFMTTHFSHYAVGYNEASFSDVPAGAWYSKPVGFIASRGITNGTGNGEYSPEAMLTRGQFIVMLLRACGIDPDEDPVDNFADAGDTYYTGYLAAAKWSGIARGVGDNRFAPAQTITRQEMFTLLHNALRLIGRLPRTVCGRTLSDFSDTSEVASWARDAMTLLVETGMITGSSGRLIPLGTATRAEMAQVLYNLLNQRR
jgi:hypothetical protein